MQAVEQVIAQAQAAGDADTVNHLTPRLEGFRQICEEAEEEQTPPTVLALGDFFQAADDAAAAAVFEAQRALLQPYEAQQMMDALAAQPPEDTDAETRQRIIARRDLLRRLRGAAPTVDRWRCRAWRAWARRRWRICLCRRWRMRTPTA
jgi:hypothetical protein